MTSDNRDNKLISFTMSFVKMLQEYYAERLGLMYVIGANWVYKGMWYLVSPFLAEKTRAKIVLVSADLHELTDQYETE